MAASARPVISNTTPLINLVGVALLDLLPALYGEVRIPEAVRDEYNAGKSATDPELGLLPWLIVVPAAPLAPSLPARLGLGEAAALSPALAENARAVLLDEAYARRSASHLGLPIVGTLSVLLAGKRAGHVPAIRPVLDEMVRQGRRISTRLQAQVLRAAGE